MGLAATAGLRAGALRAAGFRAGALRAEVFFAVVLRAGAFFLAAPVLRAVLRTARAVARPVLRAVRAAFLTVLRGLAFLRRLAFLPTRFRSHGFCSDLLCYRSRPLKRAAVARTHASLAQACRPTRRVNCFFHYTMIGSESGNLGCPSRANINNEAFPRPSQAQARARRMSSIAMRWRKSGSTNRALTRSSVPITSVAGMGNIHPP